MKIVSWNVRALGATSKKRLVKDALIKYQPDIVIHQETKCRWVDREIVKEIWSFCFVGWSFQSSAGSADSRLDWK